MIASECGYRLVDLSPAAQVVAIICATVFAVAIIWLIIGPILRSWFT